jgi:hypothetical protein
MLGDEARPLITIGRNLGVIGIVGAAALGISGYFQGFLYAYTAAYAFFLSIVLGAMFFVLTQHLTAAGWSVGVRRIAEALMQLIPVMAVLAIPLVVTVVFQSDKLYPWAGPITLDQGIVDAVSKGHMEKANDLFEASHSKPPPVKPTDVEVKGGEVQTAPPRGIDPNVLQKRITGIYWLNPFFWVFRIIVYFAIWSYIAKWYYNQSLRQDTTGDADITRAMQKWAGFWTVMLGLTLTGAAGDLLMSLDPHWFSTMWGVYYFAGSALAIFATLIIIVAILQAAGYLRNSITIEHYHDLGKYLFGFTFFWGYIAFSQYMLLWYANIPDEVTWFNRHGATTDPKHLTGWSIVILLILFGQLLIPFAGLLSRHVKRATVALVFWAVWQLAFHLLDTYWIVMPEYPGKYGVLTFAASVCAYVGIGGVLLAVLVRGLVGQNLRPVADPRLPESLAFHNI